jgi:hypothetical protein
MYIAGRLYYALISTAFWCNANGKSHRKLRFLPILAVFGVV